MLEGNKLDSKLKLSNKGRIVLMFALCMFFFAISDGIVSFLIPIVMTNSGLSATSTGILYASACGFGAIFDFVLSKVFRNTNYKRVYFYAILLLLSFPFWIFTSTAIWVFLIGMAVQGLFINLAWYGVYDFVAREGDKGNGTSTMAYLEVFNDVGYSIGPIIAAQFILGTGVASPILLVTILVIVAGMFFIATILSKSNNDRSISSIARQANKREHVKVTFKEEFSLWIIVGKKLWPLLLLSFSLAFTESLFWTATPLIDRLASNLHGLGGIIMSVSLFPSLFINWSAKPLTSKFGKKNVAYVAFLISSIVLFSVGFIQNPYIVILLVFVSALLESLAFPAIGGAFTDYLRESKSYDNEILTLKSFLRNIGFIAGPITAGFLIQRVSNLTVFSYVAVYGIIASIIMIVFSPKEIDFHDRSVRNANVELSKI